MLNKFFPEISSNGSIGIQIVSSGPDVSGEQIKRSMVKMLNSAKKSIYVQTPYLIPDMPFLEALQTASISGTDVYVMLPGVPDKWYVYYVTLSYMKELLDYGIRVFIYPGFLHSKMVVVDDEIVTIGSTNIDVRSFNLHFEVNGFIYDSTFAKKCADIFNDDKAVSTEVRLEDYNRRKPFRIFVESILRLFAPLM